jgi:hypothetical protein
VGGKGVGTGAGAGCAGGVTGTVGGVSGRGGVAQAARVPTIKGHATLRPARRNHTVTRSMTLLLLEALGALLIFLFIIWWTMFSGRKKGELPDDVEREKAGKQTPPSQEDHRDA